MLSARLDIDQIRSGTPGCEQVTHFNNAGSSLPAQQTLDTVIDYLRLESQIGGYEAAQIKQQEIEATYQTIADFIGADASEIAFMQSATHAWDSAFYSIAFKSGDRILTGRAEYSSNYIAMLQQARRFDLQVEIIEDDENGQIDTTALEKALDDDVALVALTHIPTNNGLINPAAEVGRIVEPHRACYLLDACQSAGQLDLNVDQLKCDFLTATGRKYLRAPRGTGFLYARQATTGDIEPAQIDMQAAEWTSMDDYTIRIDARRFERWETSQALKLGLKSAIHQALAIGMPAIETCTQTLATKLRESLASINAVELQDKGLTLSGIVTFDCIQVSNQQIQANLRERYNINTSLSPASMGRLNMEPKGLDSVLRASLHYYNTEQEIDYFIESLRTLLNIGK